SLAYYNTSSSSTSSIGAEAFYNCRSLNKFSVNSRSIRSIGANAIYEVNNSVFANESTNTMVILGNVLLSYRGNDQRVTIPANIVLLYNSAFEGNTHIVEVDFASNNVLTGINDRVFYGCSNLLTIDFPESIESVGDNVMDGTAWYNEKLRNDDYIIIGNTLVKYNIRSLRDAVIPEAVSVINKNAFSGMSVYDIKIGDNVELIREGAFDGIVPATWTEGDSTCTGFTLTMETAVPPALEYEEMFSNCYRIYVGDEDILDTYRLNVDWKVQFDRIKVIDRYLLAYSVVSNEGAAIDPESVHALYSAHPVNTVSTAQRQYEFVGWFLDQNYFNAVRYPLILTRNTTIYAKCVDYNIGSNPGSFHVELNNDGSNTYTIVSYEDAIDKKVVVITEQSDRKVTSITGHLGYIQTDKSLYYSLGASVDDNVYVFNDESIIGEQYYSAATGIYVFGTKYYLRKRVAVTAAMIGTAVPSGTYVIGRRSNMYLATGNYQNSTEYFTMTLMENRDIYIKNPDDPSEFVFYDKSVYTGTNYEYFRRNDVIEEITFANNCTIDTLGENCFAGMTSLKKVTLPASVKTIAANAFADCTSLEEIVFSDGISEVVIKKYAFNGCTALVDFTVPEGIKEIEDLAFVNCRSLINVYALQQKPFDLKGAMPFDPNANLRIHITEDTFNNYYSAWAPYVDYLTVMEDK
ncbi:MAG: leucine-rich repeat domain-containing protein, partial [Clostridia bacterium]|nr:leucine-rich repeat domain-containing protein [Clostridia bacterium]